MLSPERFGSYLIERRLAIGGMAELLLGRRDGPRGSSRRVVIKRLLWVHEDNSSIARSLLDEARIAAYFDHPNVIHTYELIEDDGQFGIVMEYLEGRDLAAVIKKCRARKKTIPHEIAAYIIAEAASGLHYAHILCANSGDSLRIIHRDVSPTNIIITTHGRIKVVDFRIAKHALSTENTIAGSVKGKLQYMAPEQIRGHTLDHRCDIFSLGVVLYELLTGIRCFARNDHADMVRAVAGAFYEHPREVGVVLPEPLDELLTRMLALDPCERPQSGEQVADQLGLFLNRRVAPGPHAVQEFLADLFRDANEATMVGFSPTALDFNEDEATLRTRKQRA